MIMTLNELMVKYNFISKVLLKSGDSDLSKDLKIKIMSMRIKMSKIRREFEEDLQEVIKQLTPEGYQELSSKENKTEEEIGQLNAWNKQINDEYNAYINSKGRETVDCDVSLTDEEITEIIEVNADNDVEINGQKMNAADFLEVLYSLFVV